MQKFKATFKISTLITYLLLIAGGLLMVFPFFWMITGAFKNTVEINSFPPVWIPSSFSLENFIYAFEKAPFLTYFKNSLIAMVGSVSVCTFTTILAAFAFSKLRFPGRNIIFTLLLSCMMVPFEMLIITNYRTVIDMGIYNTQWALIIPFTSSIFYTYILRGFFDSVSDSLYYSARIDGCSNWTYLWKVLVPMAKPSLVTIILLNGIASWNSFLWPMLATIQTSVRTLPFGMYAFVTEGGASTNLMMAAATITVLPMIILFLFARKYIVNGVARGGLKG